MIISHSKKFIFVHNYKVAGTSVRQALGPYGNHSFLRSSFNDKINLALGKYPGIYARKFAHHVKAPELQAKLPQEIFNSYFKFGFVRNPWDWQVSLYKFMLKRKTHHQHELVKSMQDFNEYIKWRVNEDVHLQKEFFYVGDTCLMDFIGKLENLEQDFAKICERIGVCSTLTHLNSSRTASDNYLEYYTPETIDLVYNAYLEDITLFGYSKPTLK